MKCLEFGAMASFSEDFLRFLKANFPDDYRRASVDDVKEDVVNAITSRYAHRYSLWQQIPEWVKNRYADRIPTDVLNGNESPQMLVQKELGYYTEKPKIDDSVDIGVSLLAAGYSAAVTAQLAEQRAVRAKLLAESGGGLISQELLALLLESRQKDVSAIMTDWKDNQQEKYLLHIAKTLSREKKRLEHISEPAKQQEAKMEIAALEREMKTVAQALNEKEKAENMVSYLRQPAQQAALYHMEPEVLELFKKFVKKEGIKIEPNKERTPQLELGNMSLTASLRNDFNRMVESHSILSDAAKREAVLKRIVPEKVLEKGGDAVAKVVSMRRSTHKQQTA